MFRNVDAELKRNGMTRGDLARALNLNPSTMSLKLNGKALITLDEAVKVKEILKVNMPVEELFSITTKAS
ncbi:MAG: helix-turn-helix transcriptional regulator [Hydrogenoanaerobacterium sp.]